MVTTDKDTEITVGGVQLTDERGRDILGIDKEDWFRIVGMFEKAANSDSRSLQWYPLKNFYYRLGEYFYNNFIKNSSILLLDTFWFRDRIYAVRSDGNLRNITLVSPFIYLVLECFGQRIWKLHKKKDDSHIFRYYSGSYDDSDAKYRNSYIKYCSNVNSICGFGYYIKTDVKNFYDSISIERLFEIIQEKCHDDKINYLYSLLFYKELIKYCGFGKFPTIENSVSLSYLACILYWRMLIILS